MRERDILCAYFIYIYIYIYIYREREREREMHVYIYIYIYIYIYKERQTDRQIKRDTHCQNKINPVYFRKKKKRKQIQPVD